MTDEELVQYFEAAQPPPGGFHHREHVRVAWWYARRHPWMSALEIFSSGLKRFADANNASAKYHETVTAALMMLIHDRAFGAPDTTWDEFAARNCDLLEWNPSILDRYYRAETLATDRARTTFVWPDRLS